MPLQELKEKPKCMRCGGQGNDCQYKAILKHHTVKHSLYSEMAMSTVKSSVKSVDPNKGEKTLLLSLSPTTQHGVE